MQFANKGTPIKKWVESRVRDAAAVRKLATANNITTQSVYKYMQSTRDIRVIGDKAPEIYEIKRLGK